MTDSPDHRIIRMGFDPLSDPETAAAFADDLARTFYLCWRPGHIVGPHFAAACLKVAAKLREKNPQNSADVARAITTDRNGTGDVGFPDAVRFTPDFLPYLRGEKTIGYEVVK